jgi:MFS family permease
LWLYYYTAETDLWLLSVCRVLPVLALLFLCSFLDRTNVGNASLYNLGKEIHITDHQYDIGLAAFYATYIASEIPSNLLLKKITPKIWLPALTFFWGVIAMCLGFVTNFGSFVAVRALLGFAEGGLLPGMVLYLSHLYTRGEMALRIGLFYTTASLSGAFGGLSAFASPLSDLGTNTQQVCLHAALRQSGLAEVYPAGVGYWLSRVS